MSVGLTYAMTAVALLLLLTSQVGGEREDRQALSQALQSVGSGISGALLAPGSALASVFPSGLGGLFPFSISNLPQLPSLPSLPEGSQQLMMTGLHNATQIVRASLLNVPATAVMLLAMPLLPLMAVGGPGRLAGMHHSLQMGFTGRAAPVATNSARSINRRTGRSINDFARLYNPALRRYYFE